MYIEQLRGVMNETRAQTIRRILADESLLSNLPEEDRERLVKIYHESLDQWEAQKKVQG